MVTQKETREKERSSRESLGKFFYDLAKATFTIMVLTNSIALFISTNYVLAGIFIAVGLTSTAVLARIGYALCGLGILLWFRTKSGKKWLSDL